ncbi:hypothetical protein EON83_25525 [bacterium]|nr:MAG: hypothetical protein EON83_25525 [bacterium]
MKNSILYFYTPLSLFCVFLASQSSSLAQQTTTTEKVKVKSKSPRGTADIHDVYISSGIEKSFYKSPSRSAIYLKLNPGGVPLFESYQVAGLKTPNDTSDDVWKLQCLRSPSNKGMKVHSAAVWLDPTEKLPGDEFSLVGDPHSWGVTGWYGNVLQLTANLTGYLDPLCSWTTSGSLVNNLSSFSSEFSPPDIPTIEITRTTPVINIRSRVESYAPSGFGAVVQRGTMGLILGNKIDGTDLSAFSTFNVNVRESRAGYPLVPTSDLYLVNWHLPAEWNQGSKYGGPYWDSTEAISTTQSSCMYGSSIDGVWKTRVLKAGELDRPEDYWNEAIQEAWGPVNDILGITESTEGTVDDAIKGVKDSRMRLLLEIVKKGAQALAEKKMEDTPTTGTFSGGFEAAWMQNGGLADHPLEEQNYRPIHKPSSTWIDENGNPLLQRPPIDLDVLHSSTATAAEKNAVLNAINRWRLENPIFNARKNRYLYKGDGYNEHGYEGFVYKGIDKYDEGGSFITGTFKYYPSPGAGGASNGQ